jgi:hypothetical protein
MLNLDRKAFGGLGQFCKMPHDMRVVSVDLHTGDAVLSGSADKSANAATAKVFTQEELRLAVVAGIADLKALKPDWDIENYPDLAAWMVE